MNIKVEVSEKLKQARENRDLSINQLSKRTGIPVRSLKAYEAGDKIPNSATLITLAKFLNTSLDHMLGIEAEQETIVGFTVEEFRVIRNILENKAKSDTIFNIYNLLFDKADKILNEMISLKRLHKFDYEPIPRDIESGNFFKIRREKLHITLEELATICNVTQSVVLRWESGQQPPTRNLINTLKVWLKLTDDEIETYIDPDYRKRRVMEQLDEMTSEELDNLYEYVRG